MQRLAFLPVEIGCFPGTRDLSKRDKSAWDHQNHHPVVENLHPSACCPVWRIYKETCEDLKFLLILFPTKDDIPSWLCGNKNVKWNSQSFQLFKLLKTRGEVVSKDSEHKTKIEESVQCSYSFLDFSIIQRTPSWEIFCQTLRKVSQSGKLGTVMGNGNLTSNIHHILSFELGRER